LSLTPCIFVIEGRTNMDQYSEVVINCLKTNLLKPELTHQLFNKIIQIISEEPFS
jgi:hypothetical protein